MKRFILPLILATALLVSCANDQTTYQEGDNPDVYRLGNDCVAKGGVPVISNTKAMNGYFVYCFGIGKEK